MGDCFALDALGLLLCFRQDMPSLFDILIFEVSSTTVHAICRALDLKAELVPFQDTNQEPTPTRTKKVQYSSSPPDVYSFTVFKICEALELKAHLRPLNERPMFKNINPRPVPLVHSVTVFHLCQALNLDVQLAKI
ncbi:hypothetical protein TNCV_3354081 [Trichonephila clavipes]|nr:hypothetical protein TNCV_3354081 [Trichonephila clavipes]